MLRHSSSVAAIQPCNPLASRFALYHNSMSFVASFDASHRYKLSTCRECNIPAGFRKSTSQPTAPLFTIRCSSAVKGSVRCSSAIKGSATFLKDKIEFAIYNESAQFDTLSATVRILKQGFFDIGSHALDELSGKKVKMFLVSLDIDPVTKEGKLSSESNLKFARRDTIGEEEGDSYITVLFTVPKHFGRPGAILIESQHPNEFFLKSISLNLPDDSKVYFPCHSWIVESKLNFGQPRVFFANQSYLPNETPPALFKYRHEDLIALRNNGKLGERKYGERIYDYDVYNDLGSPDKDKKLNRPVLGGSVELPYPRRCRTGRKRTKNDPAAEQPVGLDENYLPRDERFSSKKRDLFVAAGVRCLGHKVLPTLQRFLDQNRAFQTLEEIHALYVGKLRAVATELTSILRDPGNGTATYFPPPGVVAANTEAWRSDEEFGRQRLAGANPVVIERLRVFPPVSRLDEEIYGPATSSITERHLERYLGGLTVEEAMEQKRLYVVDFHDILMPFVNKVNKLKGSKMYASRTIHFLTELGVLVPIAIELTLPPERRGEKAVSRVITPSKRPGVTDWLWQLAKTHVASADCAVHQLSSHWLRSHAVIEPFIIAARRQMSTMHPFHVLLSPHFKDTMHINAMARASLLHSDDLIEKLFTAGMYCGEISSAAYKDWRFDEEALPKDLLKRGVAEEDPSAKHGLRLTIKDYPFATDALDMWTAIRRWVSEYLAIYYKDDEAVQHDIELQSWWSEATNVGHADKAGAEWWGEMRTREAVVEAGTTLIWLASGHHAALNFGQYAYAGFMPNYPSMTRQLIPEEQTAEYARMQANPEKFFLETISTQGQTTLAMATVEILAQHMSDEDYLGERNDSQWTADSQALAALHNFRRSLVAVEADIEARNAAEQRYFHRAGSVLLPYTLLAPSSDRGLTFRGVPNSISM